MSTATYVQRGETLDYLNTTSKIIPANTVIPLITRIGIAGTNILPGEVGSVHMQGVFKIEKTKAADIPMGTAVFFDGTGITTDEKDGETALVLAGYAAETVKAADTHIMVSIN